MRSIGRQVVVIAAACVLCIVTCGFAQNWQTAPTNPEFAHFAQDHPEIINSQAQQSESQESGSGVPSPSPGRLDGHPLGYVPPPVKIPAAAQRVQALMTMQARESYPSSYDLRDEDKLTAVRDQGDCGSCWAFATYGSLESSLMSAESRDFSENHLKNTHGFEVGCCDGGNALISTAYLARQSGPIDEIDDPYNVASCLSPLGLTAVKQVEEVLMYPDRAGPLDNDKIKSAVMAYGAMYTTIDYYSNYYNEQNFTYFCPYGGSYNNHSVCIVGWDDDFDKSLFSQTPAGNGAFIVRNSWGQGWGDGGYFYVSYYDHTIGVENTTFKSAEPAYTYAEVYQYDPYGWVYSLGAQSETGWFANVFTATSDNPLKAVSFYTVAPDAAYTVQVYKNPTNGPINPSGPTVTVEGYQADAGYHTVPLDGLVQLSEGDAFSVVVRMTTPGYNYPIPIEHSLGGYCHTDASPGQSYTSVDGSTWTDLTTELRDANVCLKALTSGCTGLIVTPGSPSVSHGPEGGPFTPVNFEYTVKNWADQSVTWSAAKSRDWITLSSTGGTLNPGEQAVVIVTINSNAEELDQGAYTDWVEFTNLTDGCGNARRKIELLVQSGTLDVSPDDGLMSGGQVGGPFEPGSKQYTVSNIGYSTITWTAAKTVDWLTLSQAGGTLDPGQEATVTVSINSEANSLDAGGYTDNVTFTNMTNGLGSTSREVTLGVGNIHVKTDGDDGNDGSTWLLAKKTLSAALEAAAPGQQVWVAQGTYDGPFFLKSGVSVYGGFAGAESTLDDRDPKIFKTTLDGREAGAVVTASESIALPLTIDGFTITNGTGFPYSTYNPLGGGVYCLTSALTVSGNVIVGNSANYGGGVFVHNASPTIINNVIASNDADEYGGGIYASYSQATIIGNTIVSNEANYQPSGGGIYLYKSDADIANNIIAQNSTGLCGWGSAPALSCNDVWQNEDDNYYLIMPGYTDISVDPQFDDPQNGDYHLMASSPCIDAGDISVVENEWRDVDFDARIQGVCVDIGADEINAVETPGFAPDAGSYSSAQTVTITCGTAGATIHYTTNGLDPTESDPYLYSGGAVQVNNGLVLKARAWSDGLSPSAVKSAEYNISGVPGAVCTPQFAPDGGTYLSAQTVAITCANPNATIRYTTDGNDPTESSTLYSSPVQISGSATLKAKAWKTGWTASAVKSAAYIITDRLYVDRNASGSTHDGLSWATAFLDIQSACLVSRAGNQIWVAYGQYNENVMIRPDVALYGGFAGGETALDQRDWNENPVTIDAQYSGYPATFACGGGPTTRLDGFTLTRGGMNDGGILCQRASPLITNCNISGNDSNNGGGIELRDSSATVSYCSIVNNSAHDVAAGILITGVGSPTISHNTISGNSNYQDIGQTAGGGMYCSIDGDVTIEYNTISGNNASWGGGLIVSADHATIANNSVTGNAADVSGGCEGAGLLISGGEVTITDNDISDNFAAIDGYGGGISLLSCSGLVARNTICGNRANGFGGGIECVLSSVSLRDNWITDNVSSGGSGVFCDYYASPTVANNMILRNHCYGGGGAIGCFYGSSPDVIGNTMAWNNAWEGGAVYAENMSVPTLVNNLVAYNASGIFRYDAYEPELRNNCFYENIAYDFRDESGAPWNPIGSNGNIAADPKLGSALYGNAHIQPDSPCIDAGDNSFVEQDWVDVDGQPRIQPANGTVDIGADESDDTTWTSDPVTIYVHPDGSDSNSGDSWEEPKLTIQGGINAAAETGGEVWVAAATYAERITLPEYVYVYGGFGGFETSRDQRNPADFLTILDAGGAGTAVEAVETGALLNRVDGFTVTNSGWSGINLEAASPVLEGNTIIGNVSASQRGGGGIRCYCSTPRIAGNVIAENSATTGGGIYCYGSSPVVINNTIVANDAAQGGGIYVTYGQPTIANNIVSSCSSGIYLDSYGEADVSYSDVFGNRSYEYGSYSDPSWNPNGRNGNICADPKLASTAFGNYHIQPDSPCVGAGANDLLRPEWKDIDFEARVQPTDGDVDMGADESDGTTWPVSTVVVRVTTTGNDANDGSAWDNAHAMRTVQGGINRVKTQGGQVWVKAGTFTERITVPSHVFLYGGFEGWETSPAQRDLQLGETTLNGSSGGSTVTVTSAFGQSLIDGFTITGGSAPFGGGVNAGNGSAEIANSKVINNASSYSGAGVYVNSHSVVATNSSFINNHASSSGGAIAFDSAGGLITGCTFTGNTSYNSGGAMTISYGSPRIIGNTFTGNRANHGGAAINCTGEYSNPLIANNILTGNLGLSYTSVLCFSYYAHGIIANNTVVRNTDSPSVTMVGMSFTNNAYPIVASNIVAENDVGIATEMYWYDPPTFRHNDVCGNGTNYSACAPGTGDINEDPVFVNANGGDFHLTPHSPCLNMGDDTIFAITSEDVDGQPRAPGAVDIGADERPILYVSPDGDDGDNGLSWATAKQTLQGAVDTAGGGTADVWVKASTYHESLALPGGVSLYGGFEGDEQNLDDRDWTMNVTTIDAAGMRSVITVDYGATRDTHIDGFTLANGVGSDGPGICCSGSSPTIENNIILNCSASWPSATGRGGGIYCGSGSHALINANTIRACDAFFGGGICTDEYSSPTITNNVIDGNAATYDGYEMGRGGYGGGIYCGGAAVIVNNTITANLRSNAAGGVGGGIFCENGSPIVYNNIIAFNADGISADQYDPPDMGNNDVYGNTLYDYSAGLVPGPGDISADPRLANRAQGDFHLRDTSPCRDVGEDMAFGLPDYDMDGQGRIDGQHVDIGADESYGEEYPTLAFHVKYNSPNDGPGNDWAHAWHTVGQAMDYATAGDEIWVATGDYEEQLTLKDGVALYGGFNGSESYRHERDWESFTTTLDGGDSSGTSAVLWVSGCTDERTRIDGFTITNTPLGFGGGIHCEDSVLAIENNIIQHNTQGYGGGLYGLDSDLTIHNSLFRENVADYGAGIYLEGCSGEIAGSSVYDNSAQSHCGGIHLISSDVLVRDSVIMNNHGTFGGGILCEGSPAPTIKRCEVIGNSGGGYGGGLFCNQSSPLIENCEIHANTATIGAGVFCASNSAATILNCTIAANTSSQAGGGIYCSSSNATIKNSIVAFNSHGIYAQSCTPTLACNDVFQNGAGNYNGVSPGAGDISADPLFSNLAMDDMHILAGSPCVDTGTNTGAPTEDKDGRSRPLDGDGDGAAVCDIGAFERETSLTGAIRNCPNGGHVSLKFMPVSACFLGADPSGANWTYIETPDRTAGIRVKTIAGFSIGELVHVSGTVQTDTDTGERYIQPDPDNPVLAGGTSVLGALGLRNQWLGGGASGYQSPIRQGFGFYNVGLLVQTWGRVPSTGQGYFYINDGTDLYNPNGTIGVRVILPDGAQMPQCQAYVKVTGISGTIKVGNEYVRIIRPRCASDIQPITQWSSGSITLTNSIWNVFALPGIAKYPHPESVFLGCPPNGGMLLEGYLMRFDAMSQQWVYYDTCTNPFGNCLHGDGFSLYVPTDKNNCFNFDRVAATGDQLLSLPVGSTNGTKFSFIGNPLDQNVAWSSCLITDGYWVMSLPEAVDRGLIHRVRRWNNSSWVDVTDLATGNMEARKGYEIFPYNDKLAMIVPAQ